MKKIITMLGIAFSVHIAAQETYIQTTTNTEGSEKEITHKGTITVGKLTEQNENAWMTLGNGSGRWQFAVAGHNGAFATGAKPGTGIIRKLGNQDIIFSMPNDNMVDPDPAFDTTNYNSPGITSIKFADAVNLNSLVIYNTGKVTMGTPKYDNDSNYRLYVKDGIKTERIKVEVASDNNWADYVFEKDYNLMSIKDLESYITKNKHLPEVPTTEEVLEEGVELKEMNILLLKKVEELTLHLINQNKRIEELENQIKK